MQPKGINLGELAQQPQDMIRAFNETQGTKDDSGKPPLAYIPLVAIWEEGKAFAFGAKKPEYGPWNYKKGIAVVRTVSGALRHIFQFLSGQDYDFDSNCSGCQTKTCTKHSGAHHLGCARANLAMAMDTLENYPDLDDRFKKEPR